MALFEPGQSGNPSGRPPGSRNKITVAVEKLLDDDAEAIVKKAIEMAKDGDPALLRLCLNRLSPPRKDRSISFELPQIESVEDGLTALTAIADAVAAGELTPSEAKHLSDFIANYVKAVEVTELKQQLADIEHDIKHGR